jgi:hypothetical protein
MEELLLSGVECTGRFNDVRQTEIHIAEILVSEPSSLEVKIATEGWKDVNHQ